MEDNRSTVFLRITAMIVLLFGALGALYFVINAGRNNNSILLRGLFVIWVLSPFVACFVANSLSKRWTLLTRKVIYWLTLIVTISSLLAYSGIFNTSQTKNAFRFLIVPFLSWLVLVIVILITRWLLRNTDHKSFSFDYNSYNMEKVKSPMVVLLTWAAVAGNLLFILWVTYNGINEQFKGTLPEKISYIVLMGLLATNIFLILRKRATVR